MDGVCENCLREVSGLIALGTHAGSLDDGSLGLYGQSTILMMVYIWQRGVRVCALYMHDANCCVSFVYVHPI
jgi:hypothetical protein